MIPRTPEVVASEIQPHELSPHGAVEDEDAFLEQAQVCRQNRRQQSRCSPLAAEIDRADLTDRTSGPIIHEWARESSEFHRLLLA